MKEYIYELLVKYSCINIDHIYYSFIQHNQHILQKIKRNTTIQAYYFYPHGTQTEHNLFI